MNKSHYHYGRRCGRREMMPIAALMRVSTDLSVNCPSCEFAEGGLRAAPLPKSGMEGAGNAAVR